MANLPQTLLVPVDGSPNASSAAAHAAAMAERLGARLCLLHAFPRTLRELTWLPPARYVDQEYMKYLSPEAFQNLREQTAAAAFTAAREAIGETRAPVEEKMLGGSAGEAILEHAASTADPMIVIGRRGLSHVTEVLMGSTTQHVIHHANCPVLVIR